MIIFTNNIKMIKTFVIITIVTISTIIQLTTTSVASESAGTTTIEASVENVTKDADINIWKNSKNFVSNLYMKCASETEANKSIVISPVSIHTCMALLLAGAKGQTAKELSEGLNFGTTDKNVISKNFEQLLKAYQEKDSVIHIANAIYVNEKTTLTPDYKEIVTKNFYSDLRSLDFGDSEKAICTINNWVKEKTYGKIEKIFNDDDLQADTKIVMVNAIYFKGVWQAPFDANLTRSENFWLNNENSVKVDMMHHLYANRRLGIRAAEEIPDLDATAVELPYDNSNLSMIIILPNEQNGLKAIEDKLLLSEANVFEKVINSLNEFYIPFLLAIPKFKVEYEISLKESLKKMGISNIFTNTADFSNMSPDPLFVSKSVHKAFISVDEKGTDAAAVTANVIIPRILRSFEFIANHPFLYVIKDNNGQIFFIGRITGTNF